MLDARDNEPRSYLEFVDILRQYGAAPKENMHALWRRIVFSVLISNTDEPRIPLVNASASEPT
jgi:serine/threonine-protein kinase HipA